MHHSGGRCWWGSCMSVETGSTWGISVLRLNFSVNLKLLWKKRLFKKFPYLCNMIAFFYTSNSYWIIPECSYFCFHYLILHSWWFQYIFQFGMHWNVWNTIFIQQETKTWFLNGVIKYCNEWESLFCVAGYLIMY